MRVKLQQNMFHLWIIVPAENQHLAWSGSRWVPIDKDGISVSVNDLVKVLSFAMPIEAARYAESVGFKVEHG